MASTVRGVVGSAYKDLSDRGYEPDTLFAGWEFYYELLSDERFEFSARPKEIHQYAGMAVIKCSWLDPDEAVLACTHDQHDAALIGEDTPHFYSESAKRVKQKI